MNNENLFTRSHEHHGMLRIKEEIKSDLKIEEKFVHSFDLFL